MCKHVHVLPGRAGSTEGELLSWVMGSWSPSWALFASAAESWSRASSKTRKRSSHHLLVCHQRSQSRVDRRGLGRRWETEVLPLSWWTSVLQVDSLCNKFHWLEPCSVEFASLDPKAGRTNRIENLKCVTLLKWQHCREKNTDNNWSCRWSCRSWEGLMSYVKRGPTSCQMGRPLGWCSPMFHPTEGTQSRREVLMFVDKFQTGVHVSVT